MHTTLDGKRGALSDSSRIPIGDSTLETERLVLRRFAHGDAAALHGCAGDAKVMRYWHPGPDVAATARRTPRSRRTGGAAASATSPASNASSTRPSASRWCPPAGARGLGTELCHLRLAHGFGDLGLPEIVAVIDPRNAASVALANRCELTSRREFTWQGQARVLHAMTRAEFEAGR